KDMDVLGIETRQESWSVVHLKSSAFRTGVEQFISLTGITFNDRIKEIKSYISKKGLKNVAIAIALPREDSLSMALNIPAAKSESIKGILGFELEKHIPIDPAEVSHGFQILRKEQKVFSILLAAAKKNIVEDIVRSFKEAGLAPSSISAWHSSLFNALYYSNNLSPEKNIALIGLNQDALTLDIFSNLIPVYSKSIHVEKCKKPEKECLGLLERELDLSRLSLAGPVEKRRIDESIIISDEQPQNDFLRTFSKDMSLPVKPQGLGELGLPNKAATALGAALGIAGKGRMKINLAPPSSLAKAGPFSLNNLMLFGIVLLLAFFTGSSYLLKDWITMRGLESELTDVRAKKEVVQRLASEQKALAEKITGLDKINGAYSPGPLEVLRELTTLLPRDTWLTGLDFQGDSVSIEGFSARASSLIMKMGSSKFMTDFEFSGPVSKSANGKERFKMRFNIKRPSGTAHTAKERR
ncbi:MAG: PilN domain-containing protein, partial [Thermodesulfobacteriota bacterium]